MEQIHVGNNDLCKVSSFTIRVTIMFLWLHWLHSRPLFLVSRTRSRNTITLLERQEQFKCERHSRTPRMNPKMAARQVNIDSLLEFEVITDLLEENDNNKIYDSGIVSVLLQKKKKWPTYLILLKKQSQEWTITNSEDIFALKISFQYFDTRIWTISRKTYWRSRAFKAAFETVVLGK